MGKKWKVFTGNELGALLGWWMIQSYKLINGNIHPKIAVLSSTVSSAILRSIAKKENIYFEVCLILKYLAFTCDFVLIKYSRKPLLGLNGWAIELIN